MMAADNVLPTGPGPTPEDVIDPELQELLHKYPGLQDKPADFIHQVERKELAKSVDEFMRGSGFQPPESIDGTLANFLDQPLPQTRYLVEGMAGVGHNVTITAKYKTGKTTLMLNLVKCLLDNELFLGQYDVKPLDGRIVLLNYEMDATDLQSDLLKLKIQNTERMARPLNLRGVRLDLTNEKYQEWLIDQLRKQETEILMIDTYTAALAQTGIDENDNSGVGKFTDALDYIKAESEVKNLFITAHMGRANFEEGEERTRGATRLNDWQDVGWTYTRKSGQPAFLASLGRQKTTKDAFSVEFDPDTLTLRTTGKTRKEVREVEKKSELEEKILTYLAGCDTPQSKNAIQKEIGGRREDVFSMVNQLVEDKQLEVSKGPRGDLYALPSPPEGSLDLQASLR